MNSPIKFKNLDWGAIATVVVGMIVILSTTFPWAMGVSNSLTRLETMSEGWREVREEVKELNEVVIGLKKDIEQLQKGT